MPFDPNKFQTMVNIYIETADKNFNNEYKRELNSLNGLSEEQVEHFGGSTEQMENIIKEVEAAKDKNLKQAALIDNIKALGSSTYELARKASALIP